MPQQMQLDLYRGDSQKLTFEFWEDASSTQPYDLTGATARAEIREHPGTPVLASFSCTVTEPNSIEIQLSAADSAALPPAKLAWDLEVTLAGGEVKTLLAGPVLVMADITASV